MDGVFSLDIIISVGYRVKSQQGTQFFATVQNKMHWAAHGQTAAEMIHARVDAGQPCMGLLTTRPGGIVIERQGASRRFLRVMRTARHRWLAPFRSTDSGTTPVASAIPLN